MLNRKYSMNKTETRTLTQTALIAFAFGLVTCCPSCISIPSASHTASLKVIAASPQSLNSSLLGYDLALSDHQDNGLTLILEGQTGNVSSETLSLLSGLRIPFLQFELGHDNESLDWRDFINNAPGKPRFRPISVSTADGRAVNTRFGIDEFLRMKRALNCKAAVTVNLLDGLARKISVREAAERAAGLIAYCNTESGAHLPSSYAHWPSIRARNGLPLPVRVEYVRLGSHPSSPADVKTIRDSVPHLNRNALAAWYIDCLSVYIERIRKADPDIKIMLDGLIGDELSNEIFKNPYIRDNVDLIVTHRPQTPDPAGMVQNHFAASLKLAQDTARPAACMSWNPYNQDSASDTAINCALWINNMFRNSDMLAAASMQSLLGGRNPALLIDADSRGTPKLSLTGEVMSLYARCHGDITYPVLNPKLSDPASIVSGIDVAVTSTKNNLFVHAANSSAVNTIKVDLDCSGFNLDRRLEMISLYTAPDNLHNLQPADKSVIQLKPRKGKIVFNMPPRTVSIIIGSRLQNTESN